MRYILFACSSLRGRHNARPLQWMRGAERLGRVRGEYASEMLVNLFEAVFLVHCYPQAAVALLPGLGLRMSEPLRGSVCL